MSASQFCYTCPWTITRGHFTMKSTKMTKILDRIDKPADLKNLTYPELELLSAEIREELISVVSANGGHLASNLGVVELTLALHRCFDTPRDKIVWDVGHQAYAHKLVTGRRKEFDSLRQYGGLSGFTSREESEYDRIRRRSCQYLNISSPGDSGCP